MNQIIIGICILVAVFMSFPQISSAQTESAIRVPLYRLYNAKINDHFYTANITEALEAQKNHGYRMEGLMGYLNTKANSTTDEGVYRLWNPKAGKHFYTTSTSEAERAVGRGFIREGTVGFMLGGKGEILVYRMYNPIQQKHFYTTVKFEVEMLEKSNYVWEGQLGGGLFASQDGSQILPVFSLGSSEILPTAYIGEQYNAAGIILYFGPGATNVHIVFRNVPDGLQIYDGNPLYVQTEHSQGVGFSIFGVPTGSIGNKEILMDIADSFGNTATLTLQIQLSVQN